LTDDEQLAWTGYRHMRRMLDAQLNRELERESGLSEPDYDVLSNLSEEPGGRLRARELATRLQWSSSRLTHHIGRMERRRLVRREECADDARGAVVALTDAGRRTIERAAPPHVTAVRNHFIDLLTAEQLAALTTISRTVLEHLALVADT
jgi:DNA-binding MarR family transcriptional regulator